MPTVLAAIGAVIAGALVALAVAAYRFSGPVLGALSGIAGALETVVQGSGAVLETRIRDLEDSVDRLPARWEEIKRETSRLDARARYTAGRIRKELAERGLTDDRLDSLGVEGGGDDGDGSEFEGVLPLRAEVASAPRPAEAAPAAGSWEQMARLRKFGS